jgi:hypothetical protein
MTEDELHRAAEELAARMPQPLPYILQYTLPNEAFLRLHKDWLDRVMAILDSVPLEVVRAWGMGLEDARHAT